MRKKLQAVLSLTILVALLSACSGAPPSANMPTLPDTAAPNVTPFPVTTTAATPAKTESVVATTSPSTTAAPQGSGGASQVSQSDYLDDRSTPGGLILSLFNAINRKEYLRAYSYWEDPANNPNVGPFEQYQQGYQSTASVEVTLGDITDGAAAGNRYFSAPVLLKAQTNAGQTQTFAGCYTLHLADPQLQAEPPFQPLRIQSAQVRQVENTANATTLLAGVCGDTGSSGSPLPTTDPTNISAANYLDDRSTAVQVLRSLFNAINRKEYARAYSYWQNTSGAPPFSQFQQGYGNTAAVDVTFGEPTGDAGAGQMRYRVPVMLKSQTVDGQSQYFAGCYQLHLAQPAIQATPPFEPLGIERALVQPAASENEAVTRMATVCTNLP